MRVLDLIIARSTVTVLSSTIVAAVWVGYGVAVATLITGAF